jgi:hypothetical protein
MLGYIFEWRGLALIGGIVKPDATIKTVADIEGLLACM